MPATAMPFDDFRDLLARLPAADEVARAATTRRLTTVTGAGLGRLGEMAAWLSAWSGKSPPAVARPLCAVFAGNHGVAAHRISPTPVSATAALVEHCAAGGAAVNQLCVAHDVGLKMFDLALDHPTRDFSQEPALDERGCAATMAFGMEAIAGGADLVCIGALGVAGEAASAALLAATLGVDAEGWTGDDGETDAEMQARRAAVLAQALRLHAESLADPLEALRRLGGREHAAIAGAILAARMERIPVILDGHQALAVAAVLERARPGATAHCLLAGTGGSAVLDMAAQRIGLTRTIDMGIVPEAGAGAVLAAGVARAAAACASGIMPLDLTGRA